ncbi:MAG: serine protease [Synechococcales bacterium]|nr:serine protease [Synechococcales bacterium]
MPFLRVNLMGAIASGSLATVLMLGWEFSVSASSIQSEPWSLSILGEHPRPLEELQEEGRRITVKIIGKETSGSGVLIQRRGDRYQVITNRHVLRGGTYSVQTLEGRLHAATPVLLPELQNDDLAILEFQSPVTYAIARFSRAIHIGEEVFATGFPIVPSEEIEAAASLQFSPGWVALVLDKSLMDGYQLGYTSWVSKGMSGGALLNRFGEVVAINGIHAQPLWDDSYSYSDGSQPCSAIQQLIGQYNWGIPVMRVAQLLPSWANSPNLKKLPSSVWELHHPASIHNIATSSVPYASEEPLTSLQLKMQIRQANHCKVPPNR